MLNQTTTVQKSKPAAGRVVDSDLFDSSPAISDTADALAVNDNGEGSPLPYASNQQDYLQNQSQIPFQTGSTNIQSDPDYLLNKIFTKLKSDSSLGGVLKKQIPDFFDVQLPDILQDTMDSIKESFVSFSRESIGSTISSVNTTVGSMVTGLGVLGIASGMSSESSQKIIDIGSNITGESNNQQEQITPNTDAQNELVANTPAPVSTPTDQSNTPILADTASTTSTNTPLQTNNDITPANVDRTTSSVVNTPAQLITNAAPNIMDNSINMEAESAKINSPAAKINQLDSAVKKGQQDTVTQPAKSNNLGQQSAAPVIHTSNESQNYVLKDPYNGNISERDYRGNPVSAILEVADYSYHNSNKINRESAELLSPHTQQTSSEPKIFNINNSQTIGGSDNQSTVRGVHDVPEVNFDIDSFSSILFFEAESTMKGIARYG